jgi:hypothetical protein
MDLSMDVDIHGSYLSNTSTWMWSVLSMDIQLDIHPLPSLINGPLPNLEHLFDLPTSARYNVWPHNPIPKEN